MCGFELSVPPTVRSSADTSASWPESFHVEKIGEQKIQDLKRGNDGERKVYNGGLFVQY